MLVLQDHIGTPEALGLALGHFGKVRYDSDESIRLHAHPSYELCSITSGSVVYEADEWTAIMQPGDVCITKAGEFHSMRSSDNSGWQLDFINIRHLAHTEVIALLESRDARVINGCSEAQPLMDRILHEAREPGVGATMLIHILTTELLIVLARHQKEKIDLGLPRPYSEMVYRAMGHISYIARFDTALSDMASMTGVSVSALAHAFKDELGMTPREFLRTVVMERARRLLGDSGMTVSQIAEKLGFADLASFSAFFKKHQGCCPSSYRIRRQPDRLPILRQRV